MGRLSKIRRGKKPTKKRNYERFVWEQEGGCTNDVSSLHVLRDKETGAVVMSMFVGSPEEEHTCPFCIQEGLLGLGEKH